ncbi:PPC domain-containing protein [Sorangium sp. So ce1036]|uniref:PPC domain-containing protein n=1 Tax=Sorangium sp. So ce1036 TaxID=3133328 RepID=UPI003F0B1ED7
MRSMYLLGFFVAGTIAATAAGCGGGDNGAGGSDGEGGAGGATTTTTTTTPSTTTGSSGSTDVDDGNDSIDEAAPLDGNAVQGTLEPIDADADYYSFTGTKGQPISIVTDAKPSEDELDPTYPDVVVTLLDADGNQLAQNDDPAGGNTNDSNLLTVLPADGEYFVVVQDCNAVFSGGCADPAEILSFDYALQVVPIDPDESETDSYIADTEPNDDAEQAVTLHYELREDESDYYPTFVFGSFASATDVDVYSFTPPETPEVEHALVAQLGVTGPTGIEGNGSTVEVSEIAVFDPTDLTSAYAKVDPAKGGSISVPVEAGKEYLVFVKRPEGEVGKNDFYVMIHGRTGSDPLEAEELTNGDVATPEDDLVALFNTASGVIYGVEGKLADGEIADVDVYAVPLDNVEEGWTISVACGAQRQGSGIRGLKAEVLNGDGAEIDAATHSATESETEELFINAAAIPPGAAENRLLVRVSAAAPAEDVTSRAYSCRFGYLPPRAN